MAEVPGSTKAFGIVDIILGALGVLGALINFRGGKILNLLISGLLLAAGIGIMMAANWGRILGLISCWIGMIGTGIGFVLMLIGAVLGGSFFGRLFAGTGFGGTVAVIMIVGALVMAGFFVYFLFHLKNLNKNKAVFS